MSRLLDLDDFLDPHGLTPQELYKLQSETWAQGADYERERIIKLLEDHGQYMNNHEAHAANRLIALIKGEK